MITIEIFKYLLLHLLRLVTTEPLPIKLGIPEAGGAHIIK